MHVTNRSKEREVQISTTEVRTQPRRALNSGVITANHQLKRASSQPPSVDQASNCHMYHQDELVACQMSDILGFP